MFHVVGRCSLCGGQVSVPVHWSGVHPPVPTCRSCGAKASPSDYLPKLDMVPQKDNGDSEVEALVERIRKAL